MTRVLAGDVGGTGTRLALVEVSGEQLEVLTATSYASREHDGLEGPVRSFLRELGPAAGAVATGCFGVAGPVRDGVARITNLPWTVSAERLSAETGVGEVRLLNDLEATAWGLATLTTEHFLVVIEGEPSPHTTRALLAVGTGLGQAGLVWDGRRHRPFASEGGHADFAPGNDLEIDLWRHLQHRFGHVSWERVLSGPGLANLLGFLCARHGEEPPEWAQVGTDGGDVAAHITRAARQDPKGSPRCREALDLFVRLSGVQAGNVALSLGALGGVYLAGGIVARIAEELATPDFLEAFHDKGRMRPLLQTVPVRLVLEPTTALRGAALRAALDAEGLDT